MFKRTFAQSRLTRNRIWSESGIIRSVLEASANRIIKDGNEKQKNALEESKAARKPTHKIEFEKQSESESVSETRRPALSKSGGQHERRQKAAETKVKEETLVKLHAGNDRVVGASSLAIHSGLANRAS